MKFHPDVLAVHAEFGGDLPAMQALYDRPDHLARIAELAAENERLKELIRWAHDTLYEINPSNYDHDEVCRLNGASVEVILGLAPTLGETHGKSKEWWSDRAEALSRTGAVKVKTLEWTKLSTGWISHTSFHAYEVVATANGFMATYANLDFAWGEEETMKLAAQADYERRIISALEYHQRATSTVESHETANVSDKPEGHQEPVAEAAPLTRESLQQTDAVWSMFYRDGRTLGDIAEHFGVSIYALSPWLTAPLTRHPEPVVDTEPWGYWVKHKYAEGGFVRTPCFVPEESHYTEVLPLFTRPSEQAVTEAMVEAASREYMRIFDKHLLSKHARLILTAAQEAGG